VQHRGAHFRFSPTRDLYGRRSGADGDKLKKQAGGLELGTMFVPCGNTHIPDIAIFAQQDHQMEVATGKFLELPTGVDMMRLEILLSFLQIKLTMGLHKKIQQVKHEICQGQWQIAHVRLETIARADNPYSMLEMFRRGHIITKNGAVAYVTQCNPVEVIPRVSPN
jgi:hypothetical protein